MSNMNKIHKVLCVVEPDKNSETALTQALRIADNHRADLTFASSIVASKNLRTVFKRKSDIDQNLAEAISNKRNDIDGWVRKHSQIRKPDVKIYSGIEFVEIIKHVIENQYDLVVKCADDVDWLDRLFGSEDMHLLRKCPCPVLLLKPGQRTEFRNVLATVDVNEEFCEQGNLVQSKLNEKVMEYSAAFSMSEPTSLHIGSVWEAYGEDFLRYGVFSSMPEEDVDRYVEAERNECVARLDTLKEKMKSSLGKDVIDHLRPQVHMVKGLPAKEIPLMVTKHNIDLLVMGTVARTGIPGFIIGNTAESILEQVHCSVLAIKPDEFVSPVEI
ncbi:MAG: universal stress protein, UspA [Pseudomonadales bacterium]|nr:universal stress protein, UspA [Pseudomonadales bacterium]